MKHLRNHFSILFIILFLLHCSAETKTTKSTSVLRENGESQKTYYGIKVNDILCGYLEATENLVEVGNKPMLEGELNIFFMLSALGNEFNTEIKTKMLLDPESRKSIKTVMNIKQGTIERNINISIDDHIAVINSSWRSDSTIIEIDEDVLFGQDDVYLHVKEDFLENGQIEKEYKILQIMDEEIQTSFCKKIGIDTIALAGKDYIAMIIEETNQKTGLKTKYWLAPNEDHFVKIEVLNREIFLADHRVADRIKVANMDESIFTKTNESISDVQAISYMKLKVKIQPTGVNLSVEDLNLLGQKFHGSVNENLIDGVFEIEYPRYHGENAPPFPSDYTSDESLVKYLSPERMIQSDDPVLVSKAKEITSGSHDSWEAATRISEWVADNIGYAIPGGGTARNTYDIRAGECGAHSMLVAAFSRAVGIPCRVVWGAMYVPNKGGGFGQHGWNEIYMGQADWIPIDATAFETDFVDAGHIRIGELQSTATSFNGKEIKVLEYKLITDNIISTESDLYSRYLGKYTNHEGKRTFEVLEKDGVLSVDIPGQMVLPFNDANDQDHWCCKLTPNLYLEFTGDEVSITQMILHEIITLTKQSTPETIDAYVPADLENHIGKYLFAQANKKFEVIYLDQSLAVKDPDKEKPIKLQPPNDHGGWLDEYNKNTIFFELDDLGQVTLLKIDSANKFMRDN